METSKTICDRWISLLRRKAEYEHQARKNGETVCSPSIDDICNEIEAYFAGLTNSQLG